jgi:hypothetical protein
MVNSRVVTRLAAELAATGGAPVADLQLAHADHHPDRDTNPVIHPGHSTRRDPG